MVDRPELLVTDPSLVVVIVRTAVVVAELLVRTSRNGLPAPKTMPFHLALIFAQR